MVAPDKFSVSASFFRRSRAFFGDLSSSEKDQKFGIVVSEIHVDNA
jgi:hypothetical protein